MKKSEIASIINAKPVNAAIFTVEIDRPAKVRKEFKEAGLRVLSRVQMQACSYSARKAVKESVASGEREEVQLPKYVATSEKLGKANFWLGFNGTEYLAHPVIPCNAEKRFVDASGKEISEIEARVICLASEFAVKTDRKDLQEKGQDIFAAIKTENIIAVH